MHIIYLAPSNFKKFKDWIFFYEDLNFIELTRILGWTFYYGGK